MGGSLYAEANAPSPRKERMTSIDRVDPWPRLEAFPADAGAASSLGADGELRPPGSRVSRRAALTGIALLPLGCDIVSGIRKEQPILVDGWLILPSDIKFQR